jgi:hypothetical protein
MGQFANQASQQAMEQQLGMGGQQWQQQMQSGQFGNQAQQQEFMQQQQRAQFGNQAQQQEFQQGMMGGQYADQQRAQQFGELKDLQGMFGGQADSRFQRELMAAQFQNQQRAQAGQEQLQFGNQGYQQQMQQAQFQQQQRQNAITEQMQREGWSLNKINAMLSGQQVNTPSFSNQPNSTNQGYAGADYLGAAGMAGQDYRQGMQSQGDMWGGLASMAGGLGSAYITAQTGGMF